ncbi:MAG: clostripain-related cysteine peptidase [Paraprevotella sp.]|nr:clostripain-related cysteine peptidase [Paraprevotella sp.]
MKNLFFRNGFLLLCLLAGLAACSEDDSSPTAIVTDDNNYCLMSYCAGGNYQHDYSLFTSVEEAAEQTKSNPNVGVTVLFSYSDASDVPGHSGVRRYVARNGKLEEDTTFNPGADFKIYDPARLSDFVRWSVEQYPNRKNLFVFSGHGDSWFPNSEQPFTPAALESPDVHTRSTLMDHGKSMSSADLAKGLKDTGVPFEAMIAHSCLQGNVESLAEWEGCARYLISSPFSIPDIAYDYTALIRDLGKGISLEQALASMARRAMSMWQEYEDKDLSSVVTLTRIDDLTPLWNVLKETFAYMRESVDEISHSTDSPAVAGEPFYKGYNRAFDELKSFDG